MKIDVFPHIYPAKYLEALRKKVPTSVYEIYEQVERTPGLVDIERRLKILDKYDDVVQVLNIASPPIETMVGPKDAIDLCKLGNDEMAELTAKYPDRFVGAIASLPMNDMDAALSEADRAIRDLGFRGVQIYTDVNGKPLDSPEFKPLWEKMTAFNLPFLCTPGGKAANLIIPVRKGLNMPPTLFLAGHMKQLWR
jgi:predicted TIM-barrel fold metal-dependent hydrolase